MTSHTLQTLYGYVRCEHSTCSGNVVSCRSVSFSAYIRIVFNDRRKDSSLNDELVPTKELSDIVTCIFTLAKFWKGTTQKIYCDTTKIKYTNIRIIKLQLNWGINSWNLFMFCCDNADGIAERLTHETAGRHLCSTVVYRVSSQHG